MTHTLLGVVKSQHLDLNYHGIIFKIILYYIKMVLYSSMLTTLPRLYLA